MDETEPIDLRIGALVILRNAVPSYVTLQTIVHRMYNERSSQLRSLMYTSLVSMAKYTGTYPQRRRLYADVIIVHKDVKYYYSDLLSWYVIVCLSVTRVYCN